MKLILHIEVSLLNNIVVEYIIQFIIYKKIKIHKVYNSILIPYLEYIPRNQSPNPPTCTSHQTLILASTNLLNP